MKNAITNVHFPALEQFFFHLDLMYENNLCKCYNLIQIFLPIEIQITYDNAINL